MNDQLTSVARAVALISVVLFLASHGGALSPALAAAPRGSEPRVGRERTTVETRRLPGWSNRGYTVHLPPSYGGRQRHPVVIVLHGGGGNKEAARLQTCPDQNPDSPECLDRLAGRRGFIVVYPDGSSESVLERTVRTFNAGGGVNGYVCISGNACKNNIDDLRFFSDLLDALAGRYRIDAKRVYVTGISNGAAMSHRLACQASDRVAAIASVAGGNQYSTGGECAPARSVPVLEIHGTADRCFPYNGGYERCSALQPYGFRISAHDTVAGWVTRNGCRSTAIVEDWSDGDPTDGTTVTQMSYGDCSDGGDVVLLRINNGGHTWPGGSSGLPEWLVGKTSREFSVNRVMLEFFNVHPMR